jgi:hypothetical protein
MRFNALEQYFEEASRRFPPDPFLSNRDLPLPIYPWREGFNPKELVDELIPIEYVLRDESQERSLTEDDRKLLDGAIREVGIDALAFYKSRRHVDAPPYPGVWGIFYLEHGVTRVAEMIEATYPGQGSSRDKALKFLREHERFHFKFDFYALSVEAKIGRALYGPLKHNFHRHRIDQVEEALANHYAWRWAKQKSVGLGDFAYDFMKLQPGAYARFDERKIELAWELAANLLDGNLSPTARREDEALWVGVVPKELSRCPEYFVLPAALTDWIDPTWKLPEIRNIIEASEVERLLKYDATLKDRWEKTKSKLIENTGLPGLDFKRWPKAANHWSVRINDNFRAHLCPIPPPPGTWKVDDIGSHKAMGHG